MANTAERMKAADHTALGFNFRKCNKILKRLEDLYHQEAHTLDEILHRAACTQVILAQLVPVDGLNEKEIKYLSRKALALGFIYHEENWELHYVGAFRLTNNLDIDFLRHHLSPTQRVRAVDLTQRLAADLICSASDIHIFPESFLAVRNLWCPVESNYIYRLLAEYITSPEVQELFPSAKVEAFERPTLPKFLDIILRAKERNRGGLPSGYETSTLANTSSFREDDELSSESSYDPDTPPETSEPDQEPRDARLAFGVIFQFTGHGTATPHVFSLDTVRRDRDCLNGAHSDQGNSDKSHSDEVNSREVNPEDLTVEDFDLRGLGITEYAPQDCRPEESYSDEFDQNMTAVIESTATLPNTPADWSAETNVKIIGTLSKPVERSIEPIGPHFLAHARRARHNRTFSEDDRIQSENAVKKVEDDDVGEISEPEDPMMLARDAKDWKGQDHYAVLGLSKYRFKATEEQIKRAHRKKVLRHHPDKKAAVGSTEDDSFFKCIQKATEILLDPVKRRQFDSVDERADVEPPTKKQATGSKFYKLWGNVFKAEGRFSRTQPVPRFGDENSSKEEVEDFYNFFYNFDSWRSFEYQDEDVPDDNENRDQKRHMERKNNNARKKKKTEDSARLRKLLDDCSAADERIKKFRQAANANKNKKKIEKEAAEKKAAEEAAAKKEADAKAAKEAEETAKVEREQGKKAKEAAKNAVKKNKRVLKGSVKDANYFVEGDAPAATVDTVLNDVELIQSKIDPDEIAALASKLNGLTVAQEVKKIWSAEAERLVTAGKLKEGEAKSFSA